jgi:hypothetical protein
LKGYGLPERIAEELLENAYLLNKEFGYYAGADLAESHSVCLVFTFWSLSEKKARLMMIDPHRETYYCRRVLESSARFRQPQVKYVHVRQEKGSKYQIVRLLYVDHMMIVTGIECNDCIYIQLMGHFQYRTGLGSSIRFRQFTIYLS